LPTEWGCAGKLNQLDSEYFIYGVGSHGFDMDALNDRLP
jgi:hypothetical protein